MHVLLVILALLALVVAGIVFVICDAIDRYHQTKEFKRMMEPNEVLLRRDPAAMCWTATFIGRHARVFGPGPSDNIVHTAFENTVRAEVVLDHFAQLYPNCIVRCGDLSRGPSLT